MTKLPKISIENTGPAQTSVPFTFGQVFMEGALPYGQALEGRLSSGAMIQLQADYKAKHRDGSARHVIISGVLPELTELETVDIELLTSDAKPTVASKATLTPSGSVELRFVGVNYFATLTSVPKSAMQWLAGPVAQEWIADAPLVDKAGKPHPLLTLRAGIRWYASGAIRVEIIVENTKTWAAASRFTYDVAVTLNGAVAFEQKGLTHYHHARWRKVFWIGKEPAIDVKIDARYLMGTKAVSNYADLTIPPDRELANLDKQITASNTGPMTIGPLVAYMPTSGGRSDIGPLPSCSVMWLLSRDRRALKAMMAAGDGSGSWSIHYRDEKTGYPVRTDSEANKSITTHFNMREQGPLPVPRYVGNDGSLGDTPFTDDTAHQPSLAYLPYLVTGDYFYLEELQFWASSNSLGTGAGNHEGRGLVHWQQIRGQAWSLRTLGHAAYITPDDHPLKGYFESQLKNNIDLYYETYVVGNPNKLGVYDGSGKNAFQVDSPAVWQMGFLDWAFAYLAELGYDKALDIHKWFTKFLVGLMTHPDYCWLQAASPLTKFRAGPGAPMYDNYETLYKANFSGAAYMNDNGKEYRDPDGVKYIDLPCGSEAQRAFLERAHGHIWAKNRMTGYSDSSTGYPSNIQPALALAVDAGVPNADKAWQRLSTRGAPPYYPDAPQWAIVPRGQTAAVPAPEPEPAASIELIDKPAEGFWVMLGDEGDTLTFSEEQIVRYGTKKKYVWAKVRGTFTVDNVFFKSDPFVGELKYLDGFMPVPEGTPGPTPEPTPTPTPVPTPVPVPDPQPTDPVPTPTPGEVLDKIMAVLAGIELKDDVTISVTFPAKTK